MGCGGNMEEGLGRGERKGGGGEVWGELRKSGGFGGGEGKWENNGGCGEVWGCREVWKRGEGLRKVGVWRSVGEGEGRWESEERWGR